MLCLIQINLYGGGFILKAWSLFIFFILISTKSYSLNDFIDSAVSLNKAISNFSIFFKHNIVVGIHDTSFYGHKVLLSQNLFSEHFESPKLELISPHGTAVAQVIGNHEFGVNPNVIFGSFTKGIYLENFESALALLKAKNIKLVNISMTIRNTEIIKLLNKFIDEGGIVILSAGNSAKRLGRELPEQYENFKGITVSATDLEGNLLEFSHYSKGKSVLAPGQEKSYPVNYLRYNQIASKSEPEKINEHISIKQHQFGMTSAAAPVVTGAVSLALQINPNLTQAEINKALLAGPQNKFGQPKLDIYSFLKTFIKCSN